ncbi:PepSY domain-containing protein [Streptomyces sp. NPDC059783]|uniref:PepSY domain-containing protein n=1 Tax=Streptomyces sp. NPDC059783 TaxID=3346944 RepID=UPI003662D7BF
MKRKLVVAAVTAAVLVGGTAATAVAFADDGARDHGSRAGAPAATRVTAAEAATAALKAVPGTVTEVELEDEHGGPVWDVDVYGTDKAWHHVTVDTSTGKAAEHRSGDDRGKDSDDRKDGRAHDADDDRGTHHDGRDDTDDDD